MGEQREPISGRRLSTSEHSPQARQLVLRLPVQIFVNLAEPTTDPTSWVCKAWQSPPPARPLGHFNPAGSPSGVSLRQMGCDALRESSPADHAAKCRCRGTDAFNCRAPTPRAQRRFTKLRMRTSLRTSDGRPQALFDDDRSGLIWKASAAATASPSYVAAADRAEGTIAGRGLPGSGKETPGWG